MNKEKEKKAIVWTIAGSDSGGGAGIQADLLTFADFDVHGCSVITASTAQNSKVVDQVFALPVEHIQSQLACLQQDMPAAAIKIGMLANEEMVGVVAAFLVSVDAFVVCDPVLSASSGQALLNQAGRTVLLEQLFPRIDLLTPNLPEAELILQQSLSTSDDIEKAAEQLLAMGCKSVLIKGGHSDLFEQQCADYFSNGKESFWLLGEKIASPHSHGSGCTLSSAITACVAKTFPVEDALVIAKSYVSQGIRGAQAVGGGAGPVGHNGWPNSIDDFPRIFKKLPSVIPASFVGCGTLVGGGAVQLGLYPVVDSVDWIAKLLPLGVKTIQLRIKDQAQSLIAEQIAEAVEIARKYSARLFINDYWQLAIEHGAYGVHLGQEDLDEADLGKIAAAGLCLGVSTHSYWEMARAHAIAPSYIAIGPIYDTTTKQMRFSRQGVEKLTQWVGLLGGEYPLVAIGGIDYARARTVLTSGVGSVAMVSAITKSPDYVAEVERLIALIEGGGS